MDGLRQVLVGAAHGVLCTMPFVTIASRFGIFYGVCIVNRQMQGSDAVTAIRSSSGINVIA